jgi:hypothetical protein
MHDRQSDVNNPILRWCQWKVGFRLVIRSLWHLDFLESECRIGQGPAESYSGLRHMAILDEAHHRRMV